MPPPREIRVRVQSAKGRDAAVSELVRQITNIHNSCHRSAEREALRVRVDSLGAAAQTPEVLEEILRAYKDLAARPPRAAAAGSATFSA